MKRLVAFALVSLVLAIGVTACAHQRLERARLRDAAISAALIAGIVLLATQVHCAEPCNIGGDPTANRR